MLQRVFFAGSTEEAGHHAAPLIEQMDITLAGPDEILADARAGDLVLFFSEHFDRFRHACRKLREKNVATLYLVDGILEWNNAWENRPEEPACPYTMRPVLSHKVACIGASQARILTSWGNADKVEVVGIPRFESLQQINKSPADNDCFRLLVMTAKCPAFTESHRAKVIQSLRDLKRWIEENRTLAGKRVEVCWRLTGNLDQAVEVPNELNDLSGAELSAVLQRVDAVISTPSTAALEAQVLDIPTAILDYTNTPKYVRSAWTISAASHIEQVLKELVRPGESKRVLQRYLLQDALYQDGSATDRLSELIRAMLDRASDCLERGEDLQFPPRMLAHPASILASSIGFEHRDLFANRPEFSQSNLTEIQAELAHSRREIDHLNRQIQQLQNELGQAHEIFEQIQKHPIAGPVVKLRQKLLDMFSNMKKPNRSEVRKPPVEKNSQHTHQPNAQP
ncbi:MAG: hypothetical protein MK108_13285 [Mariniblastus sp.]|nr:hypothetical protein [Mariniblastus sp.]